ncbi:hypothetical protein Ciccas_013997, partial [Cichlidogyrus casuarinus]
SSNTHLLALCSKISACIAEFNGPDYYTHPVFHCSLFLRLGDHLEQEYIDENEAQWMNECSTLLVTFPTFTSKPVTSFSE